jgi:hypothetical protein
MSAFETFEIREEDRQAILLALAKLSLSRPGWAEYTRTIAERLLGEEIFDQFVSLGEDAADTLPLDAIESFSAHASYNSGTDELTYRAEPGLTVAVPVDAVCTVLMDADRSRVLGVRLAGTVIRSCMGVGAAARFPGEVRMAGAIVPEPPPLRAEVRAEGGRLVGYLPADEVAEDDEVLTKGGHAPGPTMLDVFLGWARKRGFTVSREEASGLLKVLRIDPESR